MNNKTGFLIEEHSCEAMVREVARYLRSDELRYAMKVEVKNFIEKECSVENMAEGVLAAIRYNFKGTI